MVEDSLGLTGLHIDNVLLLRLIRGMYNKKTRPTDKLIKNNGSVSGVPRAPFVVC